MLVSQTRIGTELLRMQPFTIIGWAELVERRMEAFDVFGRLFSSLQTGFTTEVSGFTAFDVALIKFA